MKRFNNVVLVDERARIVKAYLSEGHIAHAKLSELEGCLVGENAKNSAEAKRIRAAVAECLFTGETQTDRFEMSGGDVVARLEAISYRDPGSGEPTRGVLGLFSYIPEDFVALNGHELNVLLMACKDETNREMAHRLGCSESSVETYRQRLREKTGTKGTAGLVRWAIRNGYITD